jgi:hypothetical protein
MQAWDDAPVANSGPSKLDPITDAFKAVENPVKTKQFAEAARLVGGLYGILFASSTKLSGILSADLDAHISELLDYFERNPHAVPKDKISEDLLPVLAVEIELCGGKETVKEGGTATSTWGLIWLLRILSFLQLFLAYLAKPMEFNSPRAACKAAYTATLGNHHSFIVSSLVKVAMSMVPSSRDYFSLQFGFKSEADGVRECMDCSAEMARVIKELQAWVKANVGDGLV